MATVPVQKRTHDTKITRSSVKACICPVCKLTIGRGVYSIGCSDCVNYFHPKCIGYSVSQIKNNKTLKYTCRTCTKPRASCANITPDADTSTSTHQSEFASDITTSDLGNNVMQIWADRNNERMQNLFDDMAKTMKESIDEQMKRYADDFQKMADSLFASFRNEFMAGLRNVTESVSVCNEKIAANTAIFTMLTEDINQCRMTIEALKSKVEQMEKENAVLQRRLNRANIVVKGLPKGLADITQAVLAIFDLCNVNLGMGDIQHCCYFEGGKSVLVKLNSVLARDMIMANYHHRYPIQLRDVIGGNIQSRIHLFDHFTPNAVALVDACRKLIDNNVVSSYKIINGDRPYARVTFIKGGSKSIYLNECEQILRELNEVSDVFNGEGQNSSSNNDVVGGNPVTAAHMNINSNNY